MLPAERMTAVAERVRMSCRWLQDEISTGLDSSTTFLITKCIRNFVHMQDVRTSCACPDPQLVYISVESEVLM